MSSSSSSVKSCVAKMNSIQYGKGEVRITKVRKNCPSEGVVQLKEVKARVLLRGDFESSFTAADNSLVIPTDTCKNTLYFLSHKNLNDDIEKFGICVVNHFLSKYNHVSAVEVSLEETNWKRVSIDGKPHNHTFIRANEKRLAEVKKCRNSPNISVQGGLRDLRILKTTGSGFVNFHRCDLTTLKDIDDRILSTNVFSMWSYNVNNQNNSKSYDLIDYSANYDFIVSTIIRIFSTTYSKSVQATMWSIAQKVIENIPEINDIHLDLPNLHNWHYDLKKLGGPQNDSTQDVQIFFPTDEPHGIIRCTVGRKTNKISAKL